MFAVFLRVRRLRNRTANTAETLFKFHDLFLFKLFDLFSDYCKQVASGRSTIGLVGMKSSSLSFPSVYHGLKSSEFVVFKFS